MRYWFEGIIIAMLVITMLLVGFLLGSDNCLAYSDQEIVELATEYWNTPPKICLHLEQTVYQIDSKRRLVKVEKYTNCHLRETRWIAERKIKNQWVRKRTLHIEKFIKGLI